MQIKTTVTVSAFEAIARQVGEYVSEKSTLPVLQNILLKGSKDNLTLRGTDLELYFSVSFPHPEAATFGETTVDAKDFLTFLKIMKSKPSFDLRIENSTLLPSPNSHTTLFLNQHSLKTIEAGEFPPGYSKGWEVTHSYTFDLTYLNKDIQKVLWSTSTDEARPVLNNVLFEVLENGYQFVGTNGFTIAVSTPTPEMDPDKVKQSYLIHRNVFNHLAKLERAFGPALVTLTRLDRKDKPDPNNYVVQIQGETAGTKNIPPLTWMIQVDAYGGIFPPWRAINPRPDGRTVVDVRVQPVKELAELIMTLKEGYTVLGLNQNKVHFITRTEKFQYHEEEEISPAIEAPVIVTIDAKYVKPIMALAQTQDFSLSVSTRKDDLIDDSAIKAPAVITLPGCGYFIIMPMHLSYADDILKTIKA